MSRQVELDPQWKSQLGAATLAEREREAREAAEARRGNTIEARLAQVGNVVSTFWGPIVMIDFLLGFALLWVQYPVAGGIYGGLLVAVAMIAVGLFRRATLTVSWGGVLFICGLALLVYLVVVSEMQGMPWAQRISKFFILFLMCGMLAAGRLHIRSFIVGGVAGAFINIFLFYAHVTPNQYPPYLTGFYGDKNAAGMYYAIWGILGLQVFGPRMRVAWFSVSTLFVFLTGSRTSLAALFMALAWVLLRNRLGLVARLIAAAIGYFGLTYAISNLAENKAFGDRTGTDWYRHQIELAMQAKADVTPWHGLGLNQGFVIMGPRRQWFHDSYLQAFVEGGYPFLLFTIALFVIVGLGLFANQLKVSFNRLSAEACVIVVLICAWKLGEVFMTFGAFFVLGICIAHRFGRPVDEADLDVGPLRRDDDTDDEFSGLDAHVARAYAHRTPASVGAGTSTVTGRLR